jgi:hypothetical protein
LGVELSRFKRLVDLLPQKAQVTVDGRKVPITLEGIIEGTLGISSRLSGVPTMMGLYRYVLLHSQVWMVAPGGAVSVPIDARLPGEIGAWSALHEAKEAGTTVAMWVGVAHDLLPPHVRPIHTVVRGQVVDLLDRDTVLMGDAQGRQRTVDLAQVNGLDVTGGTDFAWKLPVLWPPSSPE